MPGSRTSLHQALRDALDDEYKARATYRAVITAFGPVPPFINIVESEQRHIDMLLAVFAQRGLEPIDDPYADGLPAPASLLEAYRAGVQAEVENVALYDRLMAAATGDEAVQWVFRALRRASQDCHLPAFQRHLAGESASMGGSCCGGQHAHHHPTGQAAHHGCGCGGHRHGGGC